MSSFCTVLSGTFNFSHFVSETLEVQEDEVTCPIIQVCAPGHRQGPRADGGRGQTGPRADGAKCRRSQVQTGDKCRRGLGQGISSSWVCVASWPA